MKNRIWKALLSLALCAVLLTGAVGAVAVQIPDRVTAGPRGCNLRAAPRVGENLIVQVHPGLEMEVLSVVDGWYLVRYMEYVGYVASNFVEITSFRESDAYSTAVLPPKDTGHLDINQYRAGEHGQLSDGNFSYAFSIRPAEEMDGDYETYGGHRVEAVGAVKQGGAKFRTTMDRTDKRNIIRTLSYLERVYVWCWFYDYDGNPWYYVYYDGDQGFVNAVNLNVGGVDFGFDNP